MNMLEKIKTLEIKHDTILFSLKEQLSIGEFYALFSISKTRQKQFPIQEKENLQKNKRYKIQCNIPNKHIDTFNHSIQIIYEDEICLIVFKPSGLLVHNDGNTMDTLTSRVNYYLQHKSHPFDAQCIHRIDKDTSGLVFFCKHPFFQSYFDKQMQDHIIKKEYLAIIQGKLPKTQLSITSPISKDRHDAKKMIIHPKGKKAITQIKTIASIQSQSLLKVMIQTGRKHQIRVHLKSLGHPIINDEYYGTKIDDRKLLLQSYHLTFFHPIYRKTMKVISPMDPRFKPFSDNLLIQSML